MHLTTLALLLAMSTSALCGLLPARDGGKCLLDSTMGSQGCIISGLDEHGCPAFKDQPTCKSPYYPPGSLKNGDFALQQAGLPANVLSNQADPHRPVGPAVKSMVDSLSRTAVAPPVAAPSVAAPPVAVAPPVVAAAPTVVAPPVAAPPVAAPPVAAPPVAAAPPIAAPPVASPTVVAPPVAAPPVAIQPVAAPPVAAPQPAAAQQPSIYATTTHYVAMDVQTTLETRTAYLYSTTLKTAYDVQTATETTTAYTTASAAWEAPSGCNRMGTIDNGGPLWVGKDCKAGPQCAKNGSLEDGGSMWVGRDCAI